MGIDALEIYRGLSMEEKKDFICPKYSLNQDKVKELQKIAKTIAYKKRHGIVHWDILEKINSLKSQREIDHNGFLIPIGNVHNKDILKLAKKQYPRYQNWLDAEATKHIDKILSIVDTIKNRYSHYKPTYNHIPIYKSYCRYHKNILCAIIGNDKFVLKSPRGYSWVHDYNGVKLQHNKTKNDYHFDTDDVFAGIDTIVAKLQQLAEKRKQQIIAAKKEAAILKNACKNGVWVCLQDSLKSGNCKVGTLSYIRRYNLDEKKHYKIDKLPKDNNDSKRIALAALSAQRRQIKEFNQGFCEVNFA